jgi:hypothetical protein
MKQSENWPETPLEDWFASLRIIPPRDPGSIQRGRQAFLAQASTLTLPVSQTQLQRLTGWIFTIIYQLKSKEYSPMMPTFASLFLVIALLFGGSSAVALAAQSSLPDQSLYQLKTLTEDLVLSSSFNNTQRLQLELNYADRRVSEVIRLREMHQRIPQATYLRFENHIDQALQLAANSESGAMTRSLIQIRERLQNQIILLPLVEVPDPELLRIREMIQLRIGWTEFGLAEPNAFRQQAQQRTRFNHEAQSQERGAPAPDFDPGTGTEANGSVSQGEGSRNNDCQFEPCGPAPEHRYGQDQQSDDNQVDGGKDSPSPATNPNPGLSPNLQQGPGKNTDNNNSNQNATQENGSPQGNGGTH